MSRLIAIGDIHGCSVALRTMLGAIEPTPDDLLVTLGDYVDRGPDSRCVLNTLIELQDRCRLVPLLGNHELMMLAARNDPTELRFWAACGGAQTLASYDGDLANVPDDHWEFLDRCLSYYETDDFFFVHANYDPTLPLRSQPEDLVFWTHLTNAAPAAHHNGKLAVVGHTPQPNRQIRDLGHLLCLDTCCFGDGCLTACELPTRTLWQTTNLGQLLE